MGIKRYLKTEQASGNFNFGEILEKKPSFPVRQTENRVFFQEPYGKNVFFSFEKTSWRNA